MTIDDLKMCSTYRYAIQSLDESIARLRSEMERVTQVLSHAPAHSGNRDKLAEQMRRLEELETARAREVADMEEHIDRCRVWLSTIPEQQARILSMRYMDGKKWDEISRLTHYGKRHCYKIHDRALEKMAHNGTW